MNFPSLIEALKLSFTVIDLSLTATGQIFWSQTVVIPVVSSSTVMLVLIVASASLIL